QNVSAFDLIHDVLSAEHLSKDGVFAIEPVGDDVGDEELAAVGVRPGVGHGEAAALMLAVFAGGEFVGKAIPRPAATGAGGVSTLHHEIRDHAMKLCAIVKSIFGEEDEVVDGVGRVLWIQLADDRPARRVEGRGVFLLGIDLHSGGAGILFCHWVSLFLDDIRKHYKEPRRDEGTKGRRNTRNANLFRSPFVLLRLFVSSWLPVFKYSA